MKSQPHCTSKMMNRECETLFYFLFLTFIIYTPGFSQPGHAQQARQDTQTLNRIASNNSCTDQTFRSNFNTRNEIVNRSQNYLREFPDLLLAIANADKTLLTCSQYLIKVNTTSKGASQQLQANFDKVTIAYEECMAAADTLSKGRDEVVKMFFITATAGGISIIVLIILVFKIKSAKELLLEEGKKIFDDTIDAIREKLIDLLLGGSEDEKWKKKFAEIQALHLKYQRKELTAGQFKVQLNELLTP